MLAFIPRSSCGWVWDNKVKPSKFETIMEDNKPKIEPVVQTSEDVERQKLMEDFYKKYFETQTKGLRKISLDNLKELKKGGVSTEQFLDYLCQSHGFLLHGSIHEIHDDKLKSQYKKIFVANKSAIAIMRSVYSNIDVNLGYPYFIREDSPLELEIHTPPDGKFVSVDRGFVYIVDAIDFKNDPEGSWQFVKEEDEIKFHTVVETEKDDFKYPVKVYNDFEQD